MVEARILWLDSCHSTNDEAAKHVASGEYTTVVSSTQTKGRGRLGRSWHSPPGSGLYLSHIVSPRFSQSMGGAIPLMAGVAIAETCEGLGVSVQLKWPNDVLINNRKLAGVLCEAQGIPSKWSAIIGIGLNLKTPPGGWPDNVPGIALEEVCEGPLELQIVTKELIRRLNGLLTQIEHEGTTPVFDAWKRRGMALGTRVRRGDVVGTFAGLSKEGALRIQTVKGMETIHAGDVHVVHGEE